MSKLIEIKFTVDTENPDEVENIMNILGGFLPKKTTTRSRKQPAASEKVETKTDKKVETKTDKKVETKTDKKVETDIKIDDVRAALAKKVGDHRDAIKAKLSELGANNVTSLDTSKFDEFYTFLTELE